MYDYCNGLDERGLESMVERDAVDLESYKIVETRLYGELSKTCRRYSNDLSLISILGILEIVKQEITDLDKTGRSLTKTIPRVDEVPDEEKGRMDTLQ